LWEDRGAGPTEIAAAPIDFAAFLRSLSGREQEIALALIRGEPAGTIAKTFHISPGRVSQIRRQLSEKWQALHGEAANRRVSLVAA
jgi:FixJ family two-component response regulator